MGQVIVQLGCRREWLNSGEFRRMCLEGWAPKSTAQIRREFILTELSCSIERWCLNTHTESPLMQTQRSLGTLPKKKNTVKKYCQPSSLAAQHSSILLTLAWKSSFHCPALPLPACSPRAHLGSPRVGGIQNLPFQNASDVLMDRAVWERTEEAFAHCREVGDVCSAQGDCASALVNAPVSCLLC